MVSGKIIDINNKDALPFVTVVFKGTNVGTTTDFDGNFSIKTTYKVDSIVITYVGYRRTTLKIKYGETQRLNIEMRPAMAELKTVKVRPGVNPALRIINNARKFRDLNSQTNLDAYQYDCYNKSDISLNNISDEMKNKAVFKPLKSLFDTANQMKNEEGKYILPVFISETFSQYFYNKNPSKVKEVIQAAATSGVGIGDQGFINDMMGSSLQSFNFNSNYVRILAKDFISPLSAYCHTYYVYTLLDSVAIDGKKCYKLKLNLRREQDLGFLGHIWIEDSTWAMKRIDVEISPSANLNFIDRLKIQQELVKTSAGPYLPNKSRLILDIAELTDKSTGVIAKFYHSYSNIVVNQPKELDFFDRLIVHEEDELMQRDSFFWNSKRPEAFTAIEKQMFRTVDSIKNLPVIKTYIDVIRLIVEGYERIGKFDIGPYVFLYGYNNVEGNRVRLGFRTNFNFSKRWVYKAYLAYGFKDERFKYSIGAEYIFNRKKWMIGGIQFRDDYDILSVTTDAGSLTGGNSSLFQAISIFGSGLRLNRTQEIRLDFVSQPKRDWTYRIGLQHNTYSPLGDFVFAYKNRAELPDSVATISNSFNNTQATLELRWAYKEMMLVRANNRVRMQRSRLPVFTLSYTRGMKGILNSGFDFDKIQLHITHHANTGVWGTADYWVSIGKIWGRLPYPLLDVARGNQVPIYTDFNYSLMDFYEFVSDEYAHASYTQHFEGLFFNRIPVLRNWKLRNFAFLRGAYGSLSQEDRNLLPLKERNNDATARPLTKINWFANNEPYLELGYGIENIFRILSLNMVHRLTYLNHPGVRTWGVNVGLRFQF